MITFHLFYEEGKTVCWKAVKDNELFLDLFSPLRTEEYLSEETLQCLERFVCAIYGMRKCSAVNEARKAIFWKHLKQKKQNHRYFIVATMFHKPDRKSP